MNMAINLGEYISRLLQENNITSDPIIGQSIAAVLIFILALIVGWIVYHLFEHYFSKWAKKTKTTLDDQIIKNVKRPIYFLVILIGAWNAVDQLTFLDIFTVYTSFIFLTVEILLIAYIITRVINVILAWYVDRKTKTAGKQISTNILIIFRRSLHAIVYIFAFLTILYVGKIDISGAIVGLGVGGIAIAFALQSVLSDVFSAFSIYFDHPFEIGDFIIVGDYAGTVSHVSMKSTRVQLLQGEELIMSNRTILDRSIRNFKKLQKRRIVFSIGVTYDTPVAKLKKIPDILKNIINNCELTDIDRIHFKEYGPFSLNFEIVYYVNAPDYVKYMDIQHKINMDIKEAFEKEDIQIAFPTQTIILNKNS
ncbi:MAG: mechanosensitive ion channel family protein [Candidatus Thermoplasmatota archaeon]|nr:mechanosensitive ion channel family protein [Candidatus Thermoplasmatota archaeon]